jgi:hypothetical protein
MNHEEAKQLLELCRPGSEEDHQDPALAEAFALLDTDDELNAWFEEQQAIDARISDSINAIEVPADLKASILAGMRLHQANAVTNQQKDDSPIPFSTTANDEAPAKHQSRTWWQTPWIGIAALFVVAMILLKPGVQSEEKAQTQLAVAGLPPVIEFLSQEISSLKSSQLQFDKQGANPDELQAFLASNHAPTPQSIPNCLKKVPTLGCITFEYEEAKLSMICFKKDTVYHLITADKASYPGKLPVTPEVFQCHDQAFKVWVEGEQVKILSVEGGKEKLPEFI